ncbi:MAG: 2-C-methyl-D-erythritol 4-phosphate cytidylyltransferase [Acidobacteria bacterium]|nr:2-C-methyl-D-erythritol 4-phosphate cytidylyltransferase [Acidobacteriota bacterium]
MKVAAILPAAGLGTRMGRYSPESSGTSRKQFMLLEGAPILIHTIRKFIAAPSVSEILVAVRQEDMASLEEQLRGQDYPKPVRLVEGGRNRQESVGNALERVAPDTDIVAVHDAVRPFVTIEQIEECIAVAAEHGAVILGIPPVDTIKQVDKAVVHSTLLRERIVLAQTPQVFRASLLREAFERAARDHFVGTDEASLVEHLGESVHVILGSDRNIKITRPSDMALANLFYQEEVERSADAGAVPAS